MPQAYRLGTNANFTMSGSSQQSAAFSAQCRVIRVATGAQPAFFEIGSNPTATSSSAQLGATCTEYFAVTPGQKIAFLQAGTAGVVSITECV
jgi:hypothetical protein